MTNPRERRIAAAAALATSLTAVFAALGGISVAQSAISAVQYQYGPRVAICHKGKTINVAKAAVPAHVRHGDTVGPCSSAAAKAKAAKAKAAKIKAEQAKDKAEEAKGKPDEAKAKAEQVNAKHDEAMTQAEQTKAKQDKAKQDEVKTEAEAPAGEKPGNGKGRGPGK